MITKIDTSYQEGNSLKNPDKLENISKGLDKELTALSENIDEILASTTYLDDKINELNDLKKSLVKQYGKDAVKKIDKTIDNLSETVSKIRDIVSKYNVNVTETRTVFDTFNTYYHEHYLATIARTKKVN
jgi:ElaB/YqjD/DUF883 family membrane-anchored ribosome-binding protein